MNWKINEIRIFTQDFGGDDCYNITKFPDSGYRQWDKLGEELGLEEIPKDPICNMGNYYAYYDVSNWSDPKWGDCGLILYAFNTDRSIKHRECGDIPENDNPDIIIKVD